MISETLRHPLSLFDVKDKVAIITGASGTFGRATAIMLSSLGAKVFLVSGSKEELEEVAAEGRVVLVALPVGAAHSLAAATLVQDVTLTIH